jgi:hypothetical protein
LVQTSIFRRISTTSAPALDMRTRLPGDGGMPYYLRWSSRIAVARSTEGMKGCRGIL